MVQSPLLRSGFAGGVLAAALLLPPAALPARAQTDLPVPPPAAAPPDAGTTYSVQELVDAGHGFFGQVSGGLASVIENAVSKYGQPNGYILGQEGGGAFFGGLRYGEGDMHARVFGDSKVYWQGPSVGWDFGADGARVMMLVYDLPSPNDLFQRYVGVAGSAYAVGGFGMSVLAANQSYVVPVRSGVGARLGVNLGYLKFTPEATWNPF